MPDGGFNGAFSLSKTLFWSVSVIDKSGSIIDTSNINSYNSNSCATSGFEPEDHNPGFIIGLVRSDQSFAALSAANISFNGRMLSPTSSLSGNNEYNEFTGLVLTEEDGYYVIENEDFYFGVPPAEYTLSINAPGFEPKTVETTLSQGQIVTADTLLVPIDDSFVQFLISVLVKAKESPENSD